MIMCTVEWVPVKKVPPPKENGFMSGYKWLYDNIHHYYTMGCYDHKSEKWVVKFVNIRKKYYYEPEDFRPTYWATPKFLSV